MVDDGQEGDLPVVYRAFRDRFPEIAAAQDSLAAAVRAAGAFDARTERLLKLAIAVGSVSEGAVRSNARRALDLGVTPQELRAVAMLAITTRGFPAAIAASGWIEEVISGR